MKFIEWNKAAIAQKLERLTPENEALWGKMSPTKMLQHLTQIQQISNGKIKVDFANTEENRPKLRHILYKEIPFPQGFAAPKAVENLLENNSDVDFNEQKIIFLAELDYFNMHYDEEGKTETNAVFGPLSKEDWIWFHRKHISHHLAQFGLWSYI